MLEKWAHGNVAFVYALYYSTAINLSFWGNRIVVSFACYTTAFWSVCVLHKAHDDVEVPLALYIVVV